MAAPPVETAMIPEPPSPTKTHHEDLPHTPPGEAPADATRRWVGLLLTPLLAGYFLFGPLPEAFTDPMRAVAALTAMMAVLWVCESVPLAATALLPLVVLPLFGVSRPAEAAGAFANDLVFLFIGGFILANGLERWGLHKRLSTGILGLVGGSQRLLVGGLMAATAFISLWISNTAAALLMMPIALAVLARGCANPERFGPAMVLGVSLAASIGGMGTPIGSTPNLLLVSTARQLYGIDLDFGRWMAVGVPLVVVFTAFCWWLLTYVLFPLGREQLPGSAETLAEERRALGPWRFGEALVGVVFVGTALAWIFREPKVIGGLSLGLHHWWPTISDGTIAIAGALALFLVPVSLRPLRFPLTWQTGGKIPWDIILLFGGGLALADGIQRSGLDQLIIQALHGLGALPAVVALVIVCLVVLLFSEVASNTATAALLLPLSGAVAIAMGAPPLFLMLPMTFAASLGFMLPAATPPNALALGTGHVRASQMATAGMIANLVGLALIVGVCYLLGFPIFGVKA